MRGWKGLHFDSFSPLARVFVSSGNGQVRALCSVTLLTLFTLMGLFTPCSTYGADEVNSYITSVFQLLEMHRAALPRLIAPANATADALIHGGTFYLAGDRGWVSEGAGRAGGLTMVRPLRNSDQPAKGDVVWLAYLPESYTEAAERVKDLEGKGCLVIAFGPKLASGSPPFAHWVDSFTPSTAADNFTRMGNVISLWTLTGELTASMSRQGKTPVYWQSIYVEGWKQRYELYKGMPFHDGVPQMAAIQPGVLSSDYIAYVDKMLEGIQEWELPKIMMLGQEMSRRAAAGHPAVLMELGHLPPYMVDKHSKLFLYLDLQKQRSELEAQLGQNGYLIFLGYSGVDLDLWNKVRHAGAKAAWIIAPLRAEVDFSQWGDVVIDQHWTLGDCAVAAQGYDIRILPPSGIAQLFIYETLMRAAGGH